MKEGMYWLAAGVMALGLNGAYHDAGTELAQRVGERLASKSAAIIELASGRVERFGELSDLAAAKEQTASCRLSSVLSRLQGKISHAHSVREQIEKMEAEQEADLAEVEADRVKIEAELAPLRFDTGAFVSKLPAINGGAFRIVRIKSPVICNRVRVKIQRNMLTVPMPQVRVVKISAGPA